MIIGLKHFHNSLKTVVTLTPGREFFQAKYAQFPLRFTEWNWDVFSLELFSFIFWDKPCQEINFKSHLNSALLCKYGEILSKLHMSRLMLFHFAFLCSLLQWNWKMPIKKVTEIFYYFVTNEKMSDFVSFLLFRFTLVIKLRNVDFQGHWNTFLYSKINDVRFEHVLSSSVWLGLGFVVWLRFWQLVEKYRF